MPYDFHLFTCNIKDTGEWAMYYCTSTKLMDVTNLIMFILMINQINLHYKFHRRVNFDILLAIYILATLGSLINFLQYAILPNHISWLSIFLVLTCSSALFFLECYFYLNKACSFIKSKKSDILCTYQIFGALLLCVVCVLLADIWNYV